MGSKDWVLVVLGVLAIAEAVLAMSWKTNDRTVKAQVARGLRIAGGIVLVVMGFWTGRL